MSPIPVRNIDKFTKEEGELVRHLVGVPCFCTDTSGQLKPNCPHKHDLTGRVYPEEHRIRGLFTGITQRKDLLSSGFFMPGDAIFSPTSGDVVSEGDKIILLAPMPHGSGDILVRQPTLKHDVLLYEATKVFYVGDSEGNKYVPEVDFRLDGKKIVWRWTGKISTREPRPGATYVAKYAGYVEWVVFIPPEERFSAGKAFGQKVFLRKLHLVETK